eukprot:g15072.t1 g15072   contig21:488291-489281(-)
MPPKRKNSKADEENESFPLKPPRSYTSYQIFFQLERHYILQTHSKVVAELPEHVDQGAADRPEKYRNIILPRDWHVVGVNRKKRQDHVNHGIITFHDLTKTISHNWNTADLETRMYCKDLAEMELTRYHRDLSAYREMYGEEAVRAQRKKPTKKPKKKQKSKSSKANLHQDEYLDTKPSSVAPPQIELSSSDAHGGNHNATNYSDESSDGSNNQGEKAHRESDLSVPSSSSSDDSNVLTGMEEAKAFVDAINEGGDSDASQLSSRLTSSTMTMTSSLQRTSSVSSGNKSSKKDT